MSAVQIHPVIETTKRVLMTNAFIPESGFSFPEDVKIGGNYFDNLGNVLTLHDIEPVVRHGKPDNCFTLEDREGIPIEFDSNGKFYTWKNVEVSLEFSLQNLLSFISAANGAVSELLKNQTILDHVLYDTLRPEKEPIVPLAGGLYVTKSLHFVTFVPSVLHAPIKLEMLTKNENCGRVISETTTADKPEHLFTTCKTPIGNFALPKGVSGDELFIDIDKEYRRFIQKFPELKDDYKALIQKCIESEEDGTYDFYRTYAAATFLGIALL